MPSLSSFALAFLTRSDCLLAYSGLRFPSSTYFMVTSTSCGSFARRTMQLYVFWRPAPMPFRALPLLASPHHGRSRLYRSHIGTTVKKEFSFATLLIFAVKRIQRQP